MFDIFYKIIKCTKTIFLFSNKLSFSFFYFLSISKTKHGVQEHVHHPIQYCLHFPCPGWLHECTHWKLTLWMHTLGNCNCDSITNTYYDHTSVYYLNPMLTHYASISSIEPNAIIFHRHTSRFCLRIISNILNFTKAMLGYKGKNKGTKLKENGISYFKLISLIPIWYTD